MPVSELTHLFSEARGVMQTDFSSPSLPAVVLAGGRSKPELEALTGQSSRALVKVHGKTMLRHIVDALRASEHIPALTVVGAMPASADYALLPDGGDFVTNVFNGVAAYADAPFVLITSSDLPFLTGENVAAFVREAQARAQETDADIIYPIVPVAACYAQFPNVRRTSLKLREGEFTGGNMMLVRPNALLPLRQQLAEAYAARKSPLRLAAMLGPGMILRLILSQKLAPGLLTLPFLEEHVSRLIGATARALICAYPEIATDLDRPADFAAAEAARPKEGVSA